MSHPQAVAASPAPRRNRFVRALMMGLASRDGVAVDDASFIDTSFPGFVELMNGAVGNGGVPALVAR